MTLYVAALKFGNGCELPKINARTYPVIRFFPLLPTENSPRHAVAICLQSTAPLPEGREGAAWKDSEPCQSSCKVCDVFDKLSPSQTPTPFTPLSSVEIVSASERLAHFSCCHLCPSHAIIFAPVIC